MIRKRTRNNVAVRDGRHPNIGHSTKINTGGNGAIRSGPSEGRRIGVHIPPDINYTASFKKSSKADRALTAIIKGIRATVTLRPVKHGIKDTHKKSGDRGIDLVRNIKELAMVRVTVRGIETTNTKRLMAEGKFTLKIVTTSVGPRINKRERGTIQNNATSRMIGTRGQTQQKPRGRKPQCTISLGDLMCLLQTNDVNSNRQRR